jgi:hypothetical protein
MAKLSSEGAMVPLLDFQSKDPSHLFIAMELSNSHVHLPASVATLSATLFARGA